MSTETDRLEREDKEIARTGDPCFSLRAQLATVTAERDRLLAQTCETCRHGGSAKSVDRWCEDAGMFVPLEHGNGQPFGCNAHQPRDPQP
jgi:hypothetical protein